MIITRTFRILTLAIASSIAFASGLAAAADVVAKVNGVAIAQNKLDLLVKAAIAQGQTDSPELRNRTRDELITPELFVEETLKKGLDKAPQPVTPAELHREGVLSPPSLQN